MNLFPNFSPGSPSRLPAYSRRFAAINKMMRAPLSTARIRTFLQIASLLTIASFTGATRLQAQTRYEVKAVPTGANLSSVVLGINQHGDVTGYTIEGSVYRGFWLRANSSQPQDVGNLGGQLTAGCAINDRRQVTGYSQDSSGNLNAFLYSENDGIRSLGTLGGTSEAFALNSSGTAVGDSSTGNYAHVPTLFGNGNVQDLGLASGSANDVLQTAFGINDSNQVVGRHQLADGSTSAFLYTVQNNQVTDLETLGGQSGEALAINKSGQIVGDSQTQDGVTHAFLYTNQLQDLGFLPGFNQASYARAVNDKSQIVGESDSASAKHAFLFSHGQLYDLTSLAVNLSAAGFRSLDVAYGINNNGVIVGYGTANDGRTIGFIAYPQQEQKPLVTNNSPASTVTENETDQGDSYSVFYSRLRDDGDWVDCGGYGYCFRPRIAHGNWCPYHDGHWIWTDQGWFWDSNENFGWACYHYGRWAYVAGVGWCWVPGHQWAPAWVCWRQSPQYVGWAPLPPDAGFNPQFQIQSWADSYYGLGPQIYTFIAFSHWSDRSYTRWVVPPAQNVTIIRQTTNITNIYAHNNVIINGGPKVDFISKQIGHTIEPTHIAFNPQPGAQKFGNELQGNQLNVIAPGQTLRTVSTVRPTVVQQISHPVVQKGWQDVPPNEATQLRQTIAQQNPVPQNLPSPTPVPTPRFVSPTANPGLSPFKPGNTPSASPHRSFSPGVSPHPSFPPNAITPSPTARPGANGSPKTNVPPNLVSPTPSAKPGTTPFGSPKTVPPNLVSPTPSKTLSTPTAKPAVSVHPSLPPNLTSPTPTVHATPERNQLATPKASPTPENAVHRSATPTSEKSPTPRYSATPEEHKLEKTPEPTPHKSPTPEERKEEHKSENAPTPHKSATPEEHKHENNSTPHQEVHETNHVEQPKVVEHHEAPKVVESKPQPEHHTESKPPPPHEEKKGGGESKGKPTPKKE